jgi:hypothetical protein
MVQEILDRHLQVFVGRLNEDDLHEWLEDYSLGELWKKNIIGGRPSR